MKLASQMKGRDAKMWLSQDIFQGVDLDLDSDDDDNEKKEEKGNNRKRKRENDGNNKKENGKNQTNKNKKRKENNNNNQETDELSDDSDLEAFVQDKLAIKRAREERFKLTNLHQQVGDSDENDDNESDDGFSDYNDDVDNDEKNGRNNDDDDFDVVALESSDDDDESEDEYTLDEKARMLAAGTLLVNQKKARQRMIDDSYNRYAFNDTNLPKWFEEDENQNNKPMLPINKAMVAKIRDRLKEINARPIKKVAEAKGRQKMKMAKKMEKMKKKATVISDSSDLTEGQKMRQIEKLYKGMMNKAKPGKTYVVSKKFKKSRNGNVKKGGGGGMKMVDKRLKSDKRNRNSSTGKKRVGRMGKRG